MNRNILLTFLFFSQIILGTELSFASPTLGTISTESYTSHFLKLPEISKASTSSQDIYWNTQAPYHVEISDTELKGYLWGPLVGYISLSCKNTDSCTTSSFGVKNDNGELSGYAWGENTGWISFNCANKETNNCASNNNTKVIITDNSELSGYAWSQNFGWIQFDCSAQSSCIKTDWRKPSLRAVTTPSGVFGAGGSPFSEQQFVSPVVKVSDIIKNEISSSEKSIENTTKTKIQKEKDKKEVSNTKKQTEETTQTKADPINKEQPLSKKEINTDVTCEGATCAGMSPFMFPLSSIAPNESQFKRLGGGNTNIKPAPMLTVDKTSESSSGLLSVFKKPKTIIEKIKNAFFLAVPAQEENENVPVDKPFAESISSWFKNLFHR